MPSPAQATLVPHVATPAHIFEVDAHSYTGQLILNVAADGSLQPGSTMLGDPISGFWNPDAQQLTFARQTYGNSQLSDVQVFTGHVWPEGDKSKGKQKIAGTFLAFAGTGATAKEVEYGWFGSER